MIIDWLLRPSKKSAKLAAVWRRRFLRRSFSPG